MLGSLRWDKNVAQLRPFALKLRDSFLIGMTPEPEHGSPCVHCVELWLASRRVWSERLHVNELPIRKDLLAVLQKENHPHLLFEIATDGTETRMDCFVYPHPACGCAKESFVAAKGNADRLNFAFSPISQIKCARYGIPSGNLWLTSATGMLSIDGETNPKTIRTFATGIDRETSRLRGVEQWMKLAAYQTFSKAQNEKKASEDFVTNNVEEISLRLAMRNSDCIGAGVTREEAIRDALLEFGRLRTLSKYSSQVKKPMLVVGANNWIRNQVPFFLLQQYDLNLMFYPTSTPCWVVGLAALSRVKTSDAPIFIFESHHEISTALTRVLGRMLEHCRPVDWMTEADEEEVLTDEQMNKNRRLSAWWNNWIYRCPKISLKDVLHLENYPSDIDNWRQYLADGQERIKLIDLNVPQLPTALRHLVKLHYTEIGEAKPSNVTGLGTLSSFLRK